MLTGPRYFAATAGRDLPNSTEHGVFNWYQIKDEAEVETARVTVWVGSKETSAGTFRLGAPAYFLSTTQRISEGTPDPVPEGLCHFVAYRVLDGEQNQRKMTLAADAQAEEVVLKRAAFLCVPVEEWHHHEHFPVKNKASCLVVYEVDAMEAAEPRITALDQFGLHSLQLDPTALLGIPVKEFQIEAAER